jgi:plasmid stability protein
MADLTIRDIPQETFDAITARARRRGQSVETAVLELMHSAANEERLRQDLDRGLRAVETAVKPTRARTGSSRSPRRYSRPEPGVP